MSATGPLVASRVFTDGTDRAWLEYSADHRDLTQHCTKCGTDVDRDVDLPLAVPLLIDHAKACGLHEVEAQ